VETVYRQIVILDCALFFPIVMGRLTLTGMSRYSALHIMQAAREIQHESDKALGQEILLYAGVVNLVKSLRTNDVQFMPSDRQGFC
jgi:hypothetical protein